MRDLKVVFHGGRMASINQGDCGAEDQSGMKLTEGGHQTDGRANTKLSDNTDGQSSIQNDTDGNKESSALKCLHSLKDVPVPVPLQNGVVDSKTETDSVKKSVKNGAITDKNIFSMIGGTEMLMNEKEKPRQGADSNVENGDVVVVTKGADDIETDENTLNGPENSSSENICNSVAEQGSIEKDSSHSLEISSKPDPQTSDSVEESRDGTPHQGQNLITSYLFPKTSKESSSPVKDIPEVQDKNENGALLTDEALAPESTKINTDDNHNGTGPIDDKIVVDEVSSKSEIEKSSSSSDKTEGGEGVNEESITAETSEVSVSVLQSKDSCSTKTCDGDVATITEIIDKSPSPIVCQDSDDLPSNDLPSNSGDSTTEVVSGSINAGVDGDGESMDDGMDTSVTHTETSEKNDEDTKDTVSVCAADVKNSSSDPTADNSCTVLTKEINNDETQQKSQSDIVAESVVKKPPVETSTAETNTDLPLSEDGISEGEDNKSENKLPIARNKDSALTNSVTNVVETVTLHVANKMAPKKAKARKSMSSKQTAVPVTALTFNVKELERKGVLDIPKSVKKLPDHTKLKVKSNLEKISKKMSPNRSPVRSPTKSPKTESPFFKEKKILKARKRKVKRSGVYKLPGELKKAKKKMEKEKKKETDDDDKMETDVSITHASITEDNNTKTVTSVSPSIVKLTETNKQTAPDNPMSSAVSMTPVVPSDSTPDKVVVMAMSAIDSKQSPPASVGCVGLMPVKQTQSALDMLKRNSQLSFTGSQIVKKAKKMIRPLMDSRSQTRTLDAFLKIDNQSVRPGLLQSQGPVPEVIIKTEVIEAQPSAFRKRKTTEEEESPYNVSSPQSEEKKRKINEGPPSIKSPPAPKVITFINPSTSLAMQSTTLRSIIPSSISSISGMQSPITLLAPGTSGSSFIPNSFNHLPIVQIFNGPNTPTSGALVNVAFAPGTASPGKSLLRAPVLQAKDAQGKSVYLTPVQVSSNQLANVQGLTAKPVFVQNNFLPSLASSTSRSVFTTMSSQSSSVGTSVLNQLLTQPPGNLLQVKREIKPTGHIFNGLSLPVTPPRTPDEHMDYDSCSQESAGVSPGGPTPPDKDIIPLCTCRISGASFQKMSTSVTYCQALDSVEGKVMGCCNKVTSAQLVRPGVKIPFMSVCEQHRKRLRQHNCCPGCGHFCTQGKFYRCRKEGAGAQHHFHQLCQVVKHGKNYCPHCGEESQQQEVMLSMEDTQATPAVTSDAKSSRIQVKARMSMERKKLKVEGEEEEDMVVTIRTIDKGKITLSTKDLPIGPEKSELIKVLAGLGQERPKKYRNLPKCLYNPAYEKDMEKVMYMLEDGHDPNEIYEDLDNQAALHGAAAAGALAIVHLLVQAGGNIHSMDKKLCTPLMYAAENNHPTVVLYLVKAGAVIDSKADDGMTALHHAAKAGHVCIMKILLDTDRLNIDITDDGGWTPLIWAAEHQELEAVKFLMKRGTDPNLRDSEENTSLHWAAYSGSVEIAEVFMEAGCELDSPNMHGDRPLHIAARQDHYEVVVLFLARGADVEGRNLKNETPMECCIDQTSSSWLALKVNRQLKSFAAKRMGRLEKLLHRDISKGRENIPIPCVNCCDDEGVPGDYQYVTDNVETTCLNINRVLGSLQCCQCKDDCSSLYCACGKSSVRCWYDKMGKLVPEFNMLEPPLIFECNKACQCWTTCNNRVVQNGVMSRLQVFKTQGRGWGCRTLVNIQKGTFICEYIGEHISDSEADRREDDSYLFDLDNKDGETYCIDARRYGNVSRFINHLCEPNLVPVKVFIDYQDLRFPRICFFASRDIQAMEELGFDYGEKFWIIKYKHFTCECGSLKCRFSKDTIQKTIDDYKLRHEEEVDTTKDTK